LQIRPISDENSVVYFSKDGPNSTKVIFFRNGSRNFYDFSL